MSSPIPDDAADSREIGRYSLCEQLSECYFGPLWSARASDAADDSPAFSIRCIEAASLADAEAFNRLAEVAFWAMEVVYEQKPAVLDVVITAERLGIVSPLFEGVTLRELLERAGRARSTVEAPVALRIAVDLLQVLKVVAEAAADDEEAQAEGYAHGGLNPDCIHVGSDGKARLLDTAVAAVASREDTWQNHPLRVAYCAPEETEGEQQADARSDVYMVGVLVAAMITGEPLLAGDSDGEGVSLDERLSRMDAEGSLVALLRRAIDPDPDARFQSAEEMAGAIRGLGAEIARPDEVARFVAAHSAGRTGKAKEKQQADSIQEPEPVTVVAPGDYPGNALPEPVGTDEDIHEQITQKVTPLPDEIPAAENGEGDALEAATDEYEPLQEGKTEENTGEPREGVEKPAAPDVALPPPPPAAVAAPPPPPPAKRKPPAIPTRISTDKIRAWTEVRHSTPPPEEPASEDKPKTDVEDVPPPPVAALEVPDWLKPESEGEEAIQLSSEANAAPSLSGAALGAAASTDGAVSSRLWDAFPLAGGKNRAVAIGLSVAVLLAVLIALALSSSRDGEREAGDVEPDAVAEPAVPETPPSPPPPPAPPSERPSAESAAAATAPGPVEAVPAVSSDTPAPSADDSIEKEVAETKPAATAEPAAVESKPAASEKPAPPAAVKVKTGRKPSATTTRKSKRRRRSSRRRPRRRYIPDDI